MKVQINKTFFFEKNNFHNVKKWKNTNGRSNDIEMVKPGYK